MTCLKGVICFFVCLMALFFVTLCGKWDLSSLCMFSHAQLFGTLWTLAHQAPLSMGFSSQGYWSGLPCPPPGALPDPEIEPGSLASPASAGGFFTTSATWDCVIVLFLSDQYLIQTNTKKRPLVQTCLAHLPSGQLDGEQGPPGLSSAL